MAVRFQLRRDTAANWASANSVLALGEPGVETDTLKVKVGDGSTAWNSLGYSITKDFADLTNTPTTLAAYGITDALSLAQLSVTQNSASGTGALSYNNATGVFEYTPPDFAGLTGDFTGSVFADDSTLLVDGVNATLNLANNSTTDLSEGTNLYYTDVRADARIAAAGITDLSDADQTVQTTDDVTFNSVTGNVITSQIDSADSSAIEIQTDVEMLAGLTVGNHIVPSSSENIDLGSASARFRDLYLSGNSAVIGDLALKRHTGGGLLVSDHSTGNPTNVTTHNITANDITAAGDVDVTGNLTMTGYIAGPATMTIDPAAVGDNTGTLVVAGNLQVDGTTTTINSQTLEVEDKNVVLGPNAANDAANNGAGITVTQPDTTDATLIYNTTDTQWELNKKLDIAGKVTSTDIDILSNNPRIRLDDSDTDNNAEVTLDNTSLRIEVDEDDAIADSLIKFRVDADTKAVITSTGRLGIGYESPSNNIHILGSDASPNVGITLQSDDTANATATLTLMARDASNVNQAVNIQNTLGRLNIDANMDVIGVGTNFKSASYNILNLQTDTDDNGSSDDGIFKITNGSAGTTKAEFRWDESEDLVHVSYGDHGRHISINSSGNVGIGTSSTDPDLKLHVDGANGYPASSGTTPVGHIAIRAKSNSSSHGANIGVADASPWGTWIQAQDANNLATSYPLLLNPNGGNVGIGTTNPLTKLYVYEDDSTYANTELMIHNNKADDAAVLRLRGERTTTTDVGQVLFDNSNKVICNIRGVTDDNTDDGALQFWTATTGSNAVVRAVIDSSGRWGLRTNDPVYEHDHLSDFGTGETKVYRRRYDEVVTAYNQGTGGSGTSTVTVTLSVVGLRGIVLTADFSGSRNNSGPDNYMTRICHSLMSEGTNLRRSDRLTGLEFAVGSTPVTVSSVAMSSDNIVVTYSVAPNGNAYDARMLFTAKGPGIQDVDVSVSFA